MDSDAYGSLFDLTGRTAIVTGGTRGIGRSVSEGLACAGARVVVASRSAESCTADRERLTAERASRPWGAHPHGQP